MKSIIAVICVGLIPSLSFAHDEPPQEKQYCIEFEEEKFEVGTKLFVTCNNDETTRENIYVKFCYLEDGKATWSQDYAEYNPEGC